MPMAAPLRVRRKAVRRRSPLDQTRTDLCASSGIFRRRGKRRGCRLSPLRRMYARCLPEVASHQTEEQSGGATKHQTIRLQTEQKKL